VTLVQIAHDRLCRLAFGVALEDLKHDRRLLRMLHALFIVAVRFDLVSVDPAASAMPVAVPLSQRSVRPITDLLPFHRVDRALDAEHDLGRFRARVDTIARNEELIAKSELGDEPMQLRGVTCYARSLIRHDPFELATLEPLKHRLIAGAIVVVTTSSFVVE